MKQFKFFMLTICILPLFLCAECHMDQDYPMYMINSSNYSIISTINSISIERGQYYPNISYPDTTLRKTRDFVGVPQENSEKKYAFEGTGTSWELVYKNLMPNDTLSVFIFDAEVLENTDWEEIRDNYMILKRYDLSLEDLQKLDFTLYYPPTEEMKDIKMYPPYEE